MARFRSLDGSSFTLNHDTLVMQDEFEGHFIILPLTELNRALRFFLPADKVNCLSVWEGFISADSSLSGASVRAYRVRSTKRSIGCQKFSEEDWAAIVAAAKKLK